MRRGFVWFTSQGHSPSFWECPGRDSSSQSLQNHSQKPRKNIYKLAPLAAIFFCSYTVQDSLNREWRHPQWLGLPVHLNEGNPSQTEPWAILIQALPYSGSLPRLFWAVVSWHFKLTITAIYLNPSCNETNQKPTWLLITSLGLWWMEYTESWVT